MNWVCSGSVTSRALKYSEKERREITANNLTKLSSYKIFFLFYYVYMVSLNTEFLQFLPCWTSIRDLEMALFPVSQGHLGISSILQVSKMFLPTKEKGIWLILQHQLCATVHTITQEVVKQLHFMLLTDLSEFRQNLAHKKLHKEDFLICI